MIAAISAGISQSESASTTPPVEYTWFKVPDLNRATHRSLGQSGAGWTFETICRLVHLIGRVGRPQAKKAARELGRLGVGLQAIADEAGVSVSKVRRDLGKLVDLGLVAVARRNVTFHADPATGRIIENRTGRSLPVVVFLTIGPEHLRAKAGKAEPAVSHPRMAPANPAILEGQGDANRDHSGGGIQRDFQTKRAPDGDAVGIGTPPAEPAGRLPAAEAPGLPAGKAGGHSAAKASQEKAVVRVDAGTDDLPVPVGRISRPAGKPQPTRQAKRGDAFPEDHREPQAFAGRDADRFAATRRRLEAEAERRRLEDAALRERLEAEERQRQAEAPSTPPAPDPVPYVNPAAEAEELRLVLDAIERKRSGGAAGKAVA